MVDEKKIRGLVNRTISGLTVLTYALTLCGLVLTLSLKSESVSSRVLPYYPRYKSAMKALEILEDDPQLLAFGGEVYKNKNDQTISATVLGIDDPSWPVSLIS